MKVMKNSVSESMNLSPEGKELKRAIRNIVTDTDEELLEYVTDITKEVIDERHNKGSVESIIDKAESLSKKINSVITDRKPVTESWMTKKV